MEKVRELSTTRDRGVESTPPSAGLGAAQQRATRNEAGSPSAPPSASSPSGTSATSPNEEARSKSPNGATAEGGAPPSTASLSGASSPDGTPASAPQSSNEPGHEAFANALQALSENFGTLDNIHGGQADGIVSTNDLQAALQSGDPKLREAARLLLESETYRAALDTAAHGGEGDGRVSMQDVQAALARFGPEYMQADIPGLQGPVSNRTEASDVLLHYFDLLDADRNGSIGNQELNRAMRDGALPASLREALEFANSNRAQFLGTQNAVQRSELMANSVTGAQWRNVEATLDSMGPALERYQQEVQQFDQFLAAVGPFLSPQELTQAREAARVRQEEMLRGMLGAGGQLVDQLQSPDFQKAFQGLPPEEKTRLLEEMSQKLAPLMGLPGGEGQKIEQFLKQGLEQAAGDPSQAQNVLAQAIGSLPSLGEGQTERGAEATGRLLAAYTGDLALDPNASPEQLQGVVGLMEGIGRNLLDQAPNLTGLLLDSPAGEKAAERLKQLMHSGGAGGAFFKAAGAGLAVGDLLLGGGADLVNLLDLGSASAGLLDKLKGISGTGAATKILGGAASFLTLADGLADQDGWQTASGAIGLVGTLVEGAALPAFVAVMGLTVAEQLFSDMASDERFRDYSSSILQGIHTPAPLLLSQGAPSVLAQVLQFAQTNGLDPRALATSLHARGLEGQVASGQMSLLTFYGPGTSGYSTTVKKAIDQFLATHSQFQSDDWNALWTWIKASYGNYLGAKASDPRQMSFDQFVVEYLGNYDRWVGGVW